MFLGTLAWATCLGTFTDRVFVLEEFSPPAGAKNNAGTEPAPAAPSPDCQTDPLLEAELHLRAAGGWKPAPDPREPAPPPAGAPEVCGPTIVTATLPEFGDVLAPRVVLG